MTVEELVDAGLALLSPGDEHHGWTVLEAEILCEQEHGRYATLYVIRTILGRRDERRWRVLLVRHRHAGAFSLIAMHRREDARAIADALEHALDHPEAQ